MPISSKRPRAADPINERRSAWRVEVSIDNLIHDWQPGTAWNFQAIPFPALACPHLPRLVRLRTLLEPSLTQHVPFLADVKDFQTVCGSECLKHVRLASKIAAAKPLP